MKTAKRQSVAPFYAVGVLWVLAGVFVPLYSVTHYVLMAAVSAVLFLAVNAIAASAKPIGEEKKAEEKKAEPKKAASTGNPELDKMLKDGNLALSEMKRLDDNIDDAGISADIVRLEEVSRKIFEEVKRDPKKLPQIRRFMDYYLPTTLKLLNAYDRMSAVGVAGENIDTTLAKVEGMMRNVVAAFEKQLDSLYGAEALDISADISVLETMMAREGLTGEPLKAQTDGGDGEYDIKLEL
ncbi:MAG: 5-bromo-4-chloroindolyl phosphate hydrolysis family protein [Oscillibacter sp.]|nr:5-bromo-4-chloroindolyl phosphate hydrolysis family protein [Oscillibacter sp.]MBQ8852251.1 5-bromo-4-chloroindolyl phosphate hydrolysis family protein [Oscillibacter sp.]